MDIIKKNMFQKFHQPICAEISEFGKFFFTKHPSKTQQFQDIPENSPPVLIRGGFFASASEARRPKRHTRNLSPCGAYELATLYSPWN